MDRGFLLRQPGAKCIVHVEAFARWRRKRSPILPLLDRAVKCLIRANSPDQVEPLAIIAIDKRDCDQVPSGPCSAVTTFQYEYAHEGRRIP